MPDSLGNTVHAVIGKYSGWINVSRYQKPICSHCCVNNILFILLAFVHTLLFSVSPSLGFTCSTLDSPALIVTQKMHKSDLSSTSIRAEMQFNLTGVTLNHLKMFLFL